MAVPNPDSSRRLRDLAVLYLNMAHRSDDYLSDAELDSVTEKLYAHGLAREWTHVQEVVMESLALYTGAEDADALIADSVRALRDWLSPAEKDAVLADLSHVARADGVVLHGERGLFHLLAEHWGVEPQDARLEQAVAPDPPRDAPWGVLHDLAYIYLHLAHGMDNELSGSEMQVMMKRLREWQPHYEEEEVRAVLNAAMECYAEGFDPDRLDAAIASVRDRLPDRQRMAALNDLIQIANADGVFLDNEEDMINQLLTAWNVDPYANYGSHGGKE